VFLGGSATGLLLTDPGAASIGVTRDVDAIIEVTSLVSYHRFTDKLRERGFSEDLSSGAPICRWKAEEVALDIMPTVPHVLGFGNMWFGPAATAAVSVELYPGRSIHIVTAPYFLATKFEAFYGRGEGNFLLSRDMDSSPRRWSLPARISLSI